MSVQFSSVTSFCTRLYHADVSRLLSSAYRHTPPTVNVRLWLTSISRQTGDQRKHTFCDTVGAAADR